MPRSAMQLRDDALRIWRAGVEAVHPARLVPEFVVVGGGALHVGDESFSIDRIGRIVVVGGGKAAGAMAQALEHALGLDMLQRTRTTGWVNVPGNAIAPTSHIRLCAARAPGVNEPTEVAASGVQEMLRMVSGLGPEDICFCVLSGGGSALLPAPVPGLELADKIELTRELSARGAAIHQMNAVRRELSSFKGGGLARACRAGSLIALILSDVPGDDLATIASGPTICGPPAPEEAIRVLRALGLEETAAGRRATALLRARGRATPAAAAPCRVTNIVIGNNAAAVDGAGLEAERLGYSHAMISATVPEGLAEDVARRLVETTAQMRTSDGPDCLVSGGEPTVRLAPAAERGLGGRNQQLALAALTELADWRRIALVAGGTDGEDGPTDAAGAWVDEDVAGRAERLGLDVRGHLARNDAYHFFERTGSLLKTGATYTNACDLRVVTVTR